MTQRYLAISAIIAMSVGVAAVRAEDPQPTTAELMQQIEQLQSRVARMETRQQTLSSKAVDDTVTRVLEDADRRSQLMQLEGFTAGYSGGRFMLGSADGNFTLMPYLLMQVRSSTSIDTSGDDSSENGFGLPNIYLGFDGNAFSKDLTFQFLWNSGDGSSGAQTLEQAWVKYIVADQLALRIGQFVDPVFKEQLVGAGYQLAADRSLMNLVITGAGQSFTQGATLIYTLDRFSVEAGLTDGINSGNTSFRDYPNASANFGVAGRAEFMASGNSAESRDFTALKDKQDLLVFGAGADWTQAGDTNNLFQTFDVQWETGGKLGMYAAYVGDYIQNGGGSGITGTTGGDDDSYNWGLLFQAGYLLNDKIELFARYDYTHLDDAIAVSPATSGATEDAFHEVTGGANYYFVGHNAKVTIDLSYLPNGAPAGAEGLGALSSGEDEFVIRGQFQLML